MEFRNIRIASAPPESGPVIYKAGKDGVTTPMLLYRQSPGYTSDALRAGIQGDVMLECVVDANGNVASAVVTKSVDQRYGLDEMAVRAARQWRFEPAKRMDEAVPVVVSIEMSFRVGRRR